jgi:hypothetical protein
VAAILSAIIDLLSFGHVAFAGCSAINKDVAALTEIATPMTSDHSEPLNIPWFDRDGHPVVPT